jgi:hypothetical protein
MKYKYFIFVILLLILILISIFGIIYNILLDINIETNIEKFTNPDDPPVEFKYPVNINISDIINVELSKSSTFYDLYVSKAEQYEEDPDINDYILAAYTSFNTTNSILNILNNTDTVIIRPSNKLGVDYIFIDLPEESDNYMLSKVIIKYDDINPGIDYKNLFNIGTVNFLIPKPFENAKTLNILSIESSSNNKTITYKLKNYSKLFSNLALVTKTKLASNISIKLKSLEFYFIDDNKSSTEYNDIINIMSDNYNEDVVTFMPTMDMNGMDDENAKLIYKYNKILKLKIPWAIYDGSIIDTINKKLPDMLGRGTRHANIIGTMPSQIKDNVNSITYLNGTVNTSIVFPDGSYPRNYTYCAITKYTNPTANRNIILKNNDDLKIGHYNGKQGIVRINQDISYDISSAYSSDLTKWIVTCIKSEKKSINKALIINNTLIYTIDNINFYSIPCSTTSTDYPTSVLYNTDVGAPIDQCGNQKRLIINDQSNIRECSDFGFAYMLIWNTLLLDNELLIISKILNNYINRNSIAIPSVSIPLIIYDGKTEEKAGKSALDIKKNTGNAKLENGLYWIKPEGASKAMQIFCIMDDDCNGGGWMLAMKSAQNSTTFKYDSIHWTNNTVLIPAIDKHFEPDGIYMDKTLDAKYHIYNIFPVTDCLAIFDSREFDKNLYSECLDDIYTDPAKQQYGWRWFQKDFNNKSPITLLRFFRNNRRVFNYTYNNNSLDSKTINDIKIQMENNGSYMPYNDFYSKYIYSKNKKNKSPYNKYIWSNQNAYLSYGFNNFTVPAGETTHRVRWGGIFNENTAPYTYTEREKIVYKKNWRYIWRTGWVYDFEKDSNGNRIIKRIDKIPEGNKEYPYLPFSVDVSGGIGLKTMSGGDIAECCYKDLGVNKSLSFKWFIR